MPENTLKMMVRHMKQMKRTKDYLCLSIFCKFLVLLIFNKTFATNDAQDASSNDEFVQSNLCKRASVMKKIKIHFVAPSSPAAQVECTNAQNFLSAHYPVSLSWDDAIYEKFYFFAGPDHVRAQSFLNAAYAPDIDVIWCARGGYGAARMLEQLKKLQPSTPPAHKILVGFSDVTVLLNYCAQTWNWTAIHAPMPSSSYFIHLGKTYWDPFFKYISDKKADFAYQNKSFKFLNTPQAFEGIIFGGNLTVLCSLVGTDHLPTPPAGGILFLEDVHEDLYRIDRLIKQLEMNHYFDSLSGIVLGSFYECDDHPTQVLKKSQQGTENLRPKISLEETLHLAFQNFKIPVIYGLPVGHNPQDYPLPLYQPVRIEEDGRFVFLLDCESSNI